MRSPSKKRGWPSGQPLFFEVLLFLPEHKAVLVRLLDDGERRLIHVTVSRVNGFVLIRVENYINNPGAFVIRNGLPVTTKGNTDYHGFGLKSIRYTAMSYGVLATFIAYVTNLAGPLDFMSNVFRMVASSMNASQRIFEIIDAKPDVVEKKNAFSLENPKGTVELDNVTFSYEKGHPVLHNISLKVEAGEMLGIVGRSGMGKSTLVSLISRLYDPDSGQVLIDGHDLKDLTFESLKGTVAMVSQESYIFMGTVAENIAYAKPDATREEILAAAAAAGAHNFICKFPDGYDSLIGSGGRRLSGGERQRLSLARAILADPKILILDEATAAVDTATERNIQLALDRLSENRTTISIAHRLSTLKNADKLVVLDEGKVVEQGTHEQLMELKGIYYKLQQLQSRALSLNAQERTM